MSRLNKLDKILTNLHILSNLHKKSNKKDLTDPI